MPWTTFVVLIMQIILKKNCPEFMNLFKAMILPRECQEEDEEEEEEEEEDEEEPP